MFAKVFIGLGNPGKEFEGTYHNAGKEAVLFLARHALGSEAPGKFAKYKKYFEYLECGDAVFVIPMTFMNESGIAVRAAAKKFNVPAERLIVAHDEGDLPLGSYRLSQGQGTAGHRGVASIIDALDSKAFARIRIGIRPAKEKVRQKTSEFVLKKIPKGSRDVLQKVFTRVASEVLTRVSEPEPLPRSERRKTS